jgi:hypothetical protein
MHRKLDELYEEIGILKVTLTGLASVSGPMGPQGKEGPPGKDALGAENYMTCPECMATVPNTLSDAHGEWHDMIDELIEDNQIPMIEEDPSGPPLKTPTYIYPTTGTTTTYGSGTYTVSSGSSSFTPIDYTPKDGLGNT